MPNNYRGMLYSVVSSSFSSFSFAAEVIIRECYLSVSIHVCHEVSITRQMYPAQLYFPYLNRNDAYIAEINNKSLSIPQALMNFWILVSQQYWNLTILKAYSDTFVLTTTFIYKYRLEWVCLQRWYQTYTIRKYLTRKLHSFRTDTQASSKYFNVCTRFIHILRFVYMLSHGELNITKQHHTCC